MTSTNQPSLSTTVAGIPLSTCIYNASGPRTNSAVALSMIASSSSGAILTKSATLTSQKGNPLPRTWHESNTPNEPSIASLNSEGLPNNGIHYYLSSDTITPILSTCNHSKPYMISLSGNTLADNLLMCDSIQDSDQLQHISAVELNLACPNIINKPIIAYDFDQLQLVCDSITAHSLFTQHGMILGVKLPPYLDISHFQHAASIINCSTINYVACINTLGNALAIDSHAEMPFIKSNDGYAGLSGPAVKYTALANVRQMRGLLKSDIDVVGVGGIQCGQDVFEMMLCGATAVQIGTCHWIEGPGCFDRICQELTELLNHKGYTSIQQVKGTLKPWNLEGAKLSRQERMKNKQIRQAQAQSPLPTRRKKNRLGFIGIESLLWIMGIYLLLEKYDWMKYLLDKCKGYYR